MQGGVGWNKKRRSSARPEPGTVLTRPNKECLSPGLPPDAPELTTEHRYRVMAIGPSEIRFGTPRTVSQHLPRGISGSRTTFIEPRANYREPSRPRESRLLRIGPGGPENLT